MDTIVGYNANDRSLKSITFIKHINYIVYWVLRHITLNFSHNVFVLINIIYIKNIENISIYVIIIHELVKGGTRWLSG